MLLDRRQSSGCSRVHSYNGGPAAALLKPAHFCEFMYLSAQADHLLRCTIVQSGYSPMLSVHR
ncbi:hypothetical protein PSEUDO8BK_30694 [Pseudomonas sp. 8BK]|nr:hypothetical protein PSEUDO8BK_30694 [Pseudomonas sp. 8BK]